MYRYTEAQIIAAINQADNRKLSKNIIHQLHKQRELAHETKAHKMYWGLKTHAYQEFLATYPINYYNVFYPDAYQEHIIHQNAPILMLIDKLRYQHKWLTLTDTCKGLGLTKNHLYNWTHGLTRPKLYTLFELSCKNNLKVSQWLNLPASTNNLDYHQYGYHRIKQVINNYRNAHNLTVKELQQRLGLSPGTYHNLQTRAKICNLDIAITIAQACEVSIDDLCYQKKAITK